MKRRNFMNRFVLRLGVVLLPLVFLTFGYLIRPISAFAADKLVVKNGSGEEVFKVEDDGSLTVVGTQFPVSNVKRTVSHIAGTRGVAVFELVSTGDMEDSFGPTFGFRISDGTYTASSNIVAMQAARDGSDRSGKFHVLIANSGVLTRRFTIDRKGNIGIGNANPDFLIDTGGAYCDGTSWVDASSWEYKKDIKELTGDEAINTLQGLNPVKFCFKKSPDERRVGFIAEDVPNLVAMKDRKGMSPMDVVAVLTKVVQEQEKLVQEQKRILKEQQNAIGELSTKVTELENRLAR